MFVSVYSMEAFLDMKNHQWAKLDKIAFEKFGKEADSIEFMGVNDNQLVYKAIFGEIFEPMFVNFVWTSDFTFEIEG